MDFKNMTREQRRRYIKRKKRNRNIVIAILLLICVALIGGTVWGIGKITSKIAGGSASSSKVESEGPKEPQVVAETVLSNSGDILIHSTVLNAAHKSGTEYNFKDMFKYVKEYLDECDLSTVNAEFSIGTAEQYNSAEMVFRVPETVLDALQYAGFDVATTANNHTNDGGESGFLRTVESLKAKNFTYTGTRADESEKKYKIVESNGIKIGMVNYTYGTFSSDGTKYLNGIPCSDATNSLVNVFSVNDLEKFYSEMEEIIADMKSDGAETITLYIHWGDEYYLEPNTYQTSIAQKMCDLGVDTIIGGHPHKVQPVELLTSEDGTHQTTCIYSMGNFLSNQVISAMDDVMGNKLGHTEDGVIYKVHYKKFDDGTVKVSKLSVIPTWVYRYVRTDGLRDYYIIPIEKSTYDTIGEKYNLDSATAKNAQASYDRTMELVSVGINDCNKALEKDIETYIEENTK